MNRLLAILAVLFFSVPLFAEEVFQPSGATTICSEANGKTYSSEILHERLAKTPSWKENADYPPLPPGKAIRLANTIKDKLVKDSHGCKWCLATVSLEHLYQFAPWPLPDGSDLTDRWWWAVKYDAYPREGGIGGGIEYLIVVVLMDGTVIDPKVRNDPEKAAGKPTAKTVKEQRDEKSTPASDR